MKGNQEKTRDFHGNQKSNKGRNVLQDQGKTQGVSETPQLVAGQGQVEAFLSVWPENSRVKKVTQKGLFIKMDSLPSSVKTTPEPTLDPLVNIVHQRSNKQKGDRNGIKQYPFPMVKKDSTESI